MLDRSRISGFDGRRILVTGATGSIGRATALHLAKTRAHVVLNGRSVEKLQQVASTLPADCWTIAPFDLDDGNRIVNWMRELTEKDGPFSGVAHTAGLQILRPLRTIDSKFTDQMLRTNITSGIMLGKALRQKVCHTDGASFVLISSTAYFIGGAGNVAYAASKGGVIATTKAMAQELLRDKIRVNCVTPGLVESDLASRSRETTTPEAWQKVLEAYPMSIGTAEDIAHAIIYLLSDETCWMTGTELQIDGGLGVA